MSLEFDLKIHGDTTPIHLIRISTGQELAKCPEGLRGRITFSNDIASMKEISESIKHFGIKIPEDKEKCYSDIPTDRIIFPGHSNFSKAFYEIYFPKIAKHNPSDYVWNLLD